MGYVFIRSRTSFATNIGRYPPISALFFVIIDNIADDVFFDILGVALALIYNKFLRPLSFAFFGFLLVEHVSAMLFVAITNQWNLFLTQYAAVLVGSLIVRQQRVTKNETKKMF